MIKPIYFGFIGLIIGLVVGFFVANSINRSEVSEPAVVQNPTNPPSISQPAADIKEQQRGGMLPAIDEILNRAKDEPNNFDAQIKAGDMYVKIQKFDTAVEFYEKASRIKPDDYATIVKIGNTLFDSNQFEKAGKWYERALDVKPDDVNVRTDFGITFVEREKPDLDRAVKEFQTSLQTNPNYEPALYNLGIAYFKKGNSDESKKISVRLETINPNSQLTQKLKQVLQ